MRVSPVKVTAAAWPGGLHRARTRTTHTAERPQNISRGQQPKKKRPGMNRQKARCDLSESRPRQTLPPSRLQPSSMVRLFGIRQHKEWSAILSPSPRFPASRAAVLERWRADNLSSRRGDGRAELLLSSTRGLAARSSPRASFLPQRALADRGGRRPLELWPPAKCDKGARGD